MEVENHQNTEAGRESEVKSVLPSGTNEKDPAVEELEESAAETKFDVVNEPGEAQHSENNDESTGAETTAFAEPSLSNKKVIPGLTLVLIGDTHSIEIGSKNILIDHDEQTNVEPFSTKLYDLCGRHISVINMLGLPNIYKIQLNQEIHAFLMLLPNGLHDSHYNSGVQRLEKAFGKGLMDYVMTVVTHESDENCESALTDLKANSSFVEKRYHTCKRSMMDESEIIALLEKVDAMVSENGPHCYSELMCDENKGKSEHPDNTSHKEERMDSSLCQQIKTVDEPEESAAKTEIKNDPVNGAKHSDKDDDSIILGEESELSSATNKGSGEVRDVNNESSSNLSNPSTEESPTSQTVSTVTKEGGELEGSAAETECDPVKRPADVEHEKNDDNIIVEEESEINPVQSAATEKGTFNMDMSGNMDKNSFSEKINRKKQYQRETETLLERLLDRLQLQDKQQQKLSPADVLKVGPPVKQNRDTCVKDVAHTFIQRLMMLDYRARYIPVRQDTPEVSLTKPVKTDNDDFEAFYSTNVDFDQSKLKTHVHPMDVQMAVFYCSDSFFKQSMITKLSQCQYALPLLVPDPVTMDIDCPLWTFRQIRKTWKITEMKDNSNIVTMKSLPICKAETPLVSFLRLGSPSLSKSQLMNTLINDRHNTFFHRNCPGSTKSRYLMDGVAEIAWYCPAGKPNDAFTDCIAFCNLHGDALSIVKQRDILTDKSSVNVVLVPTLEQGDKSTAVISALYKSPKPLIILIADNDGDAVEQKKGKYKMGLNNKSQSEVSEELKEVIGKMLSGPHSSFKLESMAEVSAVKVDEADKVCQEGKSAAMKIVDLLQKMDVSKIKDAYLPCQGQLWHEWCKTNKELYHLKGNIENEKCQKQEKLKQIRQEQCNASCSEPMKMFIESLSSLSATEKEYFLKWTQIFIDALSTDDLSSILQNYDEKWAELLALKKNKKHDKTALLKVKQTELDEISTKVQSATFGLEHIFREMGQIYEAHAALQKQTKSGQTDWSKYPELAAELMISGQPMELMDGDAGYVPLAWISGLLDEVIKKLGDRRVFVLSVLGVQSSGKSTMLNAMFGLQFAVSAGRCTKGAFMQLVELSEEIKKDFQFDYVLVVDTEGLRALELEGKATLQHDNELATFVVGLGDMTLINIMGENPAEMQDVLQIVVQAFMRMKKIKLSPSCVFVHQNVTDIAATEKNREGKRQLQEKLDQMAQLAAKEEDCVAECFSDIIEFDVQKDVKYFSPLWEGSPPMAPPNPGYSESVQELKTIILSKASPSAGITLSQFKSKIQDLWNALMNEQFVFSFKNTLEVAVYRKLEVQYGNWTWSLRSNMLTIKNWLHSKIENGRLDQVELSYLHQESYKTYDEVKKAMATYFDDDGDKEMLVQWRGRFENKIKDFHDEQVKGVQRKLNEVIQQKHACKKLDAKKTEFENKLLQKSKELAHQLKDKNKNEEELKKQFNAVWSGLVGELIADTKPIEDINYEEDQSTVLQDLGFEYSLIRESKKNGRYKQMPEAGDYAHYVCLSKRHDPCNTGQQFHDNEMERDTRGKGKSSTADKVRDFVSEKTTKVRYYFKGHFQFEEQQLIRSLIDDVEKQSLESTKSKPVAARGYSPTYLQEVVNNVKRKVTEFESQKKYALKKEFTVDLLLYVFHTAESWLSESHKTFKGNNDAHSYVESKKEHYYNIFKSFCKGSSSAVVLGELICDKLKSSTVKVICNRSVIDLADQMKNNFPAFNGNRSNLETHMLKSLAEKEDFNGFIAYIRHPRKQAETYIREEVQKYIFTEQIGEALKILKRNVEEVKKDVSQALFDATEKVQGKTGGPEMWVEEFSSLLKDELTFNTVCCQNFSDITNIDFLKEEIEKGFESVIQEVSSLSLDKIEEFRMKPEEILIDQLCNCCWEKCPFCSAVCTNTINDHEGDHSVPFHRSKAVNGWYRRNTVELAIEFCTTSVASDRSFYPTHDSKVSIPYKKYRTAGPCFANWAITPDGSQWEYWKWFVSRFEKELEKHYALKFQGNGEIPSEWKTYSKEQAIKSLDNL